VRKKKTAGGLDSDGQGEDKTGETKPIAERAGLPAIDGEI
jgi:hypothetical protein